MKYLPDIYIEKVLDKSPKIQPACEAAEVAAHLAKYGLEAAQDDSTVVPLPLPAGFGSLWQEVDEAASPYRDVLAKMLTLAEVCLEKVQVPDNYTAKSGWNYWQNGQWKPMPQPPQGKTMVYDIETVQVGEVWLPTCAVALTAKGWALWVTDFADMPSVIPMGIDNNIVGWNIGYDRQYSSSDYTLDMVNYYIDMMSMWVVCSGMSNQQTIAWKAAKKSDFTGGTWVEDTCTNSLAEVYKHFFKKEIDKGVRDNIVEDGLVWVQSHMSEVIQYCVSDVFHTLELLQVLLPKWANRRPSIINQAGTIIMGGCKLPLSASRFPEFYQRAEAAKDLVESEISAELLKHIIDYANNIPCSSNIWANTLDWSAAKTGKNKGKVAWLRKLESKHSKGLLTLSVRDATTVLQLYYLGSPIYWKEDIDDLDSRGKAKGGWYTDNYGYLPHPENKGEKLTNLFVKGYVKLFEDGVITGNEKVCQLLAKKVSLINWISVRKRVAAIKAEKSDRGYLMTLPPLVPTGAVTGRSKDGGGSVWLVAPNPKPNRIGTELKSMVEAPNGYSLVGADVASEEAWLAGILGDSLVGFCGSTPLGLSNIIGNTAAKTDIHSLAAAKVGIDRTTAKTLVYGCLYGQGLKGCRDFLAKSNPQWDDAQVESTALGFLDGFKGVRQKDGWGLGYFGGIASEAFNAMDSIAEARQPQTPLCGAWMSESLAGNSYFKPTRVNWVCQASGVDFRDLLLLLTESFAKKLGVQATLCIAIHDEVRYLVPHGQEMKMCYTLQLAHLYTRFAFIQALGLDNLPAGVCWFPEIDVDNVLRKDPSDPQVTPTQTALPLGYTVTPSNLFLALNASSVL